MKKVEKSSFAGKDESSLIYETLAVIVKTRSNKYFQVALTKEMADSLFYDLKNYFKNDTINVLPDEISGISLEVIK